MKPIKEANELTILWRSFGPNTYPIDLIEIFRELVLPRAKGDLAEIVFGQFDSFEGVMIRRDETKNSWLIGVNQSIQYRGRRNFTLAHEIGHFVGHRREREKFECDFAAINDFEIDVLEKQANEFAAQLLMPQDLIREHDSKERYHVDSVSTLSDALGVSKVAAAIRVLGTTKKRLGFCVSRDGFVCWGRASEPAFQCGAFFRSAEALPVGCLTLLAQAGKIVTKAEHGPDVWRGGMNCTETVYVASVGGYTYTFLEYE